MNHVQLADWCTVQEPSVGLLSGQAIPETNGTTTSDSGSTPRGFQSLESLILKEKDLSVPTILKCWAGFLLTFRWLHEFSPSRYLLRGNVALWELKYRSTKKALTGRARQSFPTIQFLTEYPSLDDFPGEMIARLGTETSLYPADESLPDHFQPDRFSPPEARAEALVTPAADVYVAASMVLGLLAKGTVAPHPEDVPLVIEGLRLFQPDVPISVQRLLTDSLAENPEARPADPQQAYDQLCQVIDDALTSIITPWQVIDSPPICYRRIELGDRKFQESTQSFVDVQVAYDDELLYEELADDLMVAAVLDGVSTTDIGTGGVAASVAKNLLLPELDAVLARKNVQDKWPTEDSTSLEIYEWLCEVSNKAITSTHRKLVRKIVKLFQDEMTLHTRTPETTITLALMFGDHCIISWVGDSLGIVADPDGAVCLTSPTTAGFQAMVETRSTTAYREKSSAGALVETLGALAKADNEEDPSLIRITRLPIVVRHAPVRLGEKTFLILATDGVFDYLDVDPVACLNFTAKAAREAWKLHVEPQRAAGHLFDSLWEESRRRKSPDDRTLLVLTGQTTSADE